eukprot:103173_1
MSMPVYLNSTYFVGVVGIDIPLLFLSDAIGDIIIGRKSYPIVFNPEGEVILHPLISDPLTTLFSSDDQYNAVYIKDLEPNEIINTLLSNKTMGWIKIEALVKQPSGQVEYNGYVYQRTNLSYVYSRVGPTALTIAIVIYTDAEIDPPNVKEFGLNSSPNNECDETRLPYNCIGSFNMFQETNLMLEYNFSWIERAGIVIDDQYTNGAAVSLNCTTWYLQPGGWEKSADAINTKPTRLQLQALHALTNRLPAAISNDEMPFGGFRAEMSRKILNSIYTMSTLDQFWRSSYLKPNSTFLHLYFATYQGLMIMYPGIQLPNNFNPLVRPWYQRAVSYPDLFVFTTPYFDAATGQLIASGATVITAPNSIYPYGVAAFDYKFNDFITYWNDIMNPICDEHNNQRCYLIDTSGFLIYYQGISDDINDKDISIKFLGDFEPTLMQSLLDIGFFMNNTNVNFEGNTIDISYVTNNEVYYRQNLSLHARPFSRNNGLYTIHMISGTNLYIIHIRNYHKVDAYIHDVPSPGCLKSNGKCDDATVDVCIVPDYTISSNNPGSCDSLLTIDTFGICILNSDMKSDMCASTFINDDCVNMSRTKSNKWVGWACIILSVIGSLIMALCICIFVKYRDRQDTDKIRTRSHSNIIHDPDDDDEEKSDDDQKVEIIDEETPSNMYSNTITPTKTTSQYTHNVQSEDHIL